MPILILLGFCQLCASWGSLTIIAVQLEMRSGLGITATEVAALVWAFSLSLALGAPAAQVLIGHWPRRAVLFASLTLLGAGAILLGFAQTWGQAMGARIVMALGAASVLPTASVIAASLVPEEDRASALSVVFAGLTASLVVAVPISSAIAEAFGWRMAWFVAGVAALVAAVGVQVGTPGGVRGTRASLPAMLAVFADRQTVLTIATTHLLIGGGFLTYALIAFWFVEVGQAPRSALTLALLVAGMASMVGNGASALLVRRFGRDGTILIGLFFTILCFATLWLVPHIHVLSYPAFVLFGAGWAMCLAPLQARLVEKAGARAQLALALNSSAFFGGQALGAALGGVVYQSLGPDALPLASLCLICVTTGVFYRFAR